MISQRTTIIDIRDGIAPEILKFWEQTCANNPGLSSPFFSPEFILSVASARTDVELAVMENARGIVAILPFERLPWNIAGPVGSFLSDYQGVIAPQDFIFDLRTMLRACRLAALQFNYTPAAHQVSCLPFHCAHYPSPIIDLSAGYAAYVMERREAGSEQLRKNANLVRRIEREVGPLRFVAHSADRHLLETVLMWKTEQYRRHNWRDLFSIPWVRQTINSIYTAHSPGFGGMLSLLFAGDKLVAGHFGMRSATTWHYWFPSYDKNFSKYSPGVMLLLKLAEAAPAMGVDTIDMGCGMHSYKERLMNRFISTAKLSLELTCPTTVAKKLWTSAGTLPHKTRKLISKTSIGALARRVRDGAASNHRDAL